MPNKFLAISRLTDGEVREFNVPLTRASFVTSCDIDKPVGSFCCLYLDPATDNYKAEVRQFANAPNGIEQAKQWMLQMASKYHAEGNIIPFIIESTSVYHLLTLKVLGEEFAPIVVNPYQVKSILKAEGKDDIKDAVTLAKLLLSFDMSPSNLASEKRYHLRKALRVKRKLIHTRTQVSNRIGTTLTENYVPLPNVVKIMSKSGRAMLQMIIDGIRSPTTIMQCWEGSNIMVPEGSEFGVQLEIQRPNLKPEVYLRLREIHDALVYLPDISDFVVNLLAQQKRLLDHLDFEIAETQKQIEQALDEYQHVNLLTGEVRTAREFMEIIKTAPMFSDETTMVLLAEVGLNFTDIYPDADAFTRALGLTPENKKSGGKVIGKGVAMGNEHFKPLLVQAASNFLSGRPTDGRGERFLYNWGRDYQARSDAQHARVAVARKVCKSVYHMIKKWEPYDDNQHKIVHQRALNRAAKRAVDQVRTVKNLNEGRMNEGIRAELQRAASELNQVLGIQVQKYKILPRWEDCNIEAGCGLSNRVVNVLKGANINNFSTLVLMLLAGTLHGQKGIGDKALAEIEGILVERQFIEVIKG